MQENKQPTTADTSAYYYQRIAELGLSEKQALDYGISFNPSTGDLILSAFHFNGEPVEYVPQERRKALKKLLNRKSTGEVHEGSYLRQFGRVRVHPSRMKPGGAKYYSLTGEKVPPFPMPIARANYQAGITGGLMAVVEGELKAAALDIAGVETIGFGGIGMYKLNYSLKQAIGTRLPERLPIIYDGDALEARKKDGIVNSFRTNNFLQSALKYTKQLFDYLAEIGHEARLDFVMVNPERDEKGADDLLAAAADKKAVIDDLLVAKNGYFWKAIQLHPTTYEARLKELFALDSPESFYRRHRQLIKFEKFVFQGLTFQVKDGTLVMTSDPYQIDVDSTELKINKYLSDQTEALEVILESHMEVAIQSDTGTGKTTFFINWAKLNNIRLVLAVPTRSICEQLAEKHGLFAVLGSNTRGRSADAAAAQIIVATYDTVGHIQDTHSRVLVIDEAHNLINQYGRTDALFRANTLNRLMRIREDFSKVVYLSGTMPAALLNAYDVPLIDVKRKNSPIVRLHRLKSLNSSLGSYTAAFLSQLNRDLDGNPNKVHFVLYNSTEQIEIIRQQLIHSGKLTAKQIQVITRSHLNNGEVDGMHDLVKTEQIRKGIRLVLCTCLIAEGVNIENLNVGRVYSVGVKCVSTIRQFAARFRAMDKIDLFLILPPNEQHGKGFNAPAKQLIEYFNERAEVSARNATMLSSHYGIETLSRSKTFPDIIPNFTGDAYEVDTLGILAQVYNRQVDTAPACYIIGRLLEYNGFEVYTDVQAPIDEQVEADLKNAAKHKKKQREAILKVLREELTTDPSLAITALFRHYKQTDRKQSKRLQQLAGGVISATPEVDAMEWKDKHKGYLDIKQARELIRRAAQLVFLNVDNRAEGLAKSAINWAVEWRQLQTFFGLRLLDDSKAKRKIPGGLHLDLRAKEKIKADVEAYLNEHGTNTVTDRDLVKLIEDVVGRMDKRHRMHEAPCLVSMTKAKAVQLISDVFTVESVRHGTCKKLEIATGINFAPIYPYLDANPLCLLAIDYEI